MESVLMYDKSFNRMDSLNCKETVYITVLDDSKFREKCDKENVYDDGVDSNGHYEWMPYENEWTKIDDIAVIEALDELQKKYEETIGGITQGKTNLERKWNIEIVLEKNGADTILKTNSELISMEEVHEAIDIMLKPSFFGKNLAEIRIYTDGRTES